MSKEKEKFLPSSIITVYRGSEHTRYYVEISDVIQKSNNFVVGPGRPISKEIMRNVLSMAFDEKTVEQKALKNNFIQEHILSFVAESHNRRIVWYRKAKQINMLFSDKVKIPNRKIWMPAMLFDVNRGKIKIYSLKTNERPDLTTKLCHPPLLNLTSDHTLCWGSVRTNIPEGITIDAEIALWEGFLWNSEFSHAGTGTSTKHDIITLLRKLGKSGNEFPVNELKETNKTLKTILNEVSLYSADAD